MCSNPVTAERNRTFTYIRLEYNNSSYNTNYIQRTFITARVKLKYLETSKCHNFIVIPVGTEKITQNIFTILIRKKERKKITLHYKHVHTSAIVVI